LFNRVLIYRFWGVAETLAVAILNAVTARVTTTVHPFNTATAWVVTTLFEFLITYLLNVQSQLIAILEVLILAPTLRQSYCRALVAAEDYRLYLLLF
jgi:type III secretory pathway component EscU